MEKTTIQELLYFENKPSKCGSRGVVNVYTRSNDDYVGVIFYFVNDKKYGFFGNQFIEVADDLKREIDNYQEQIKNELNGEEQFAQEVGFKLDIQYKVEHNIPKEE